jgi:pimeloyl-ACP methyl ester carboxylesterase
MKYIPIFLLVFIGFACQKEQISIGTDVHDVFFLQEKGNSMPIQLHGNVASNKLLLMVHGGPGGSSMRYRDEYLKSSNIEKEFAIVYWDQRLSGSTQGNSSDTNIALYKDDLKKVVQLLKFRYGSDKKIYLLAHSWGGFLAPYFLEDGNNQDMVTGYIHVDGAHNYDLNDSLTREMLLVYGKKEIAKNKNKDKWKEIVDYCNAHVHNESFAVGRQLNTYASAAEGLIEEIKVPNTSSFNNLITNNRSFTSETSNAYNLFLLNIDEQAYAVPISQNLYKIKLPILLLYGRYDFICPVGLKNDIIKNIGSQDVSERIFEQSGHSPRVNEPEAFWNEVINWVKKH